MRPPTGDGIHHVMVWGINVYGTEQLTAKETSKHLEARWRTPLEVWPSFQEGRAPYGKAVRQAWEIVRSRGHPMMLPWRPRVLRPCDMEYVMLHLIFSLPHASGGTTRSDTLLFDCRKFPGGSYKPP
eukprot:scaffold44889_cov83-Phaeocystis_antarctica.AAC.5